MIRPRRNNDHKPRDNKPAGKPANATPVASVAFACGHQRPLKAFRLQNCPECRTKKRQEKRDRNGARKPARTAMSAFRFPPGTEIKGLTFDGMLWKAILRVPLPGGTGWNSPVEATGYEKLGVAAKDAWLAYQAQENARRQGTLS